MAARGAVMRVFRSVFREQKTRLQVDWLTHTDEMIMQELTAGDAERPSAIAHDIERSTEYVADRCRQLALRGLLDELTDDRDGHREYRINELGTRYIRDEISAEELEELEAE